MTFSCSLSLGLEVRQRPQGESLHIPLPIQLPGTCRLDGNCQTGTQLRIIQSCVLSVTVVRAEGLTQALLIGSLQTCQHERKELAVGRAGSTETRRAPTVPLPWPQP